MNNTVAYDDNEYIYPLSENVEISNKKKDRKVYLSFKRLFDIFFSALGLIVLSPLILVVLILIFIDDPHGSPLYSQTRIGEKGRTFKFWKLRSMVVGADTMLAKLADKNEKDGPVFKIKDDPRITNVGKFIRKSSIDELPQLFNVLRGDMSIVGPRPALPNEVMKYSKEEQKRLLVKPGLTCYWQVEQNRDDISFEDWLKLDLKYIEERSAKLDLKLILKTVKVVFTCQGE